MVPPSIIEATVPVAAAPLAPPRVPGYLHQTYWWAYVHPKAVHIFEREWLVNLILFGNYRRLCDAALAELGAPVRGHTLQVACVYGDLTPRLRERLAPDACLDVVDVLPIQLRNLAAKLPADPRVALLQGDSSALACPDASYDQVLLFFLLHEQPEHVRRATLAEALRVVKPGGVVLASTAGLGPLTGDYPDYWHLSVEGWREVARRAWPGEEPEIEGYGNCLAASAALLGLAMEELTTEELDQHDPRYPVLVTIYCRRRS
jgi:SAM-dependent methyltransferase